VDESALVVDPASDQGEVPVQFARFRLVDFDVLKKMVLKKFLAKHFAKTEKIYYPVPRPDSISQPV
jgi:hypothetical protein